MRSWESQVSNDLSRLRDSDLFRRPSVTQTVDATHVRRDGRTLINFASNDYLGLTHHPLMIAAVARAAERDGVGSGAAPLISGYSPAHASAEATIARWKGTEAAVLLPSGYQANHAVIQTAAQIGRLGGGVRFLIDKLAHASLIDAIRGAGEEFRVFPHNHIPKLRRLLDDHPPSQLQVVVTESIFSMDGDAAELKALVQLKQEHDFFLVLDEAHASGIYGPDGQGLAAEVAVTEHIDASVITLSKALGSVGGAICGSRLFCDAVINYARAYLFSTSVPPSVAASAQTAIEIIQQEPQRRSRLRSAASSVRAQLRISTPHLALDSPIIPLILGTENAALQAANALIGQGILVAAVRPPTVPKGTSRLRITVSSEHTDEEISKLIGTLGSLKLGRSAVE